MKKGEFEGTSRRSVLGAGVAVMAGGLAAAARAQGAAGQQLLAQAAQKIAQSAVQYQTTPNKDGQKCSTCVNFEAPSSCKIIAGTISPDGWCIAYAPKAT